MIVHVFRAAGQLFHPRFIWLLVKAFALTALILGALYAGGLFGVVTWIQGLAEGTLAVFGEVLAGLVLFVLFIIIYLPVSAIVLSLFVEEAVRVVETRHYPANIGKREAGIMESLGVGLRFAGVLIVMNLLALPFYILLPGLNIVLFLVLNGYLSGREYFEMVAAHHMDAPAMRSLRKRFGLRVFLAGVIIALLLAVPIVNFVAPLFGAAFMVHVFQDMARHAGLTQTENAA